MKVQRLLVIEFLSLRSKEDSIIKRLCWTDEIYQGEFDDLSRCNLDCREPSESSPSKLDNSQLDPDVLQVFDLKAQVIIHCYITTRVLACECYIVHNM